MHILTFFSLLHLPKKVQKYVLILLHLHSLSLKTQHVICSVCPPFVTKLWPRDSDMNKSRNLTNMYKIQARYGLF